MRKNFLPLWATAAAVDFVPRMCPLNYRWEAAAHHSTCFTAIHFSSLLFGSHNSFYGYADPSRPPDTPAFGGQPWWRADGLCSSIGGHLATRSIFDSLDVVADYVLRRSPSGRRQAAAVAAAGAAPGAVSSDDDTPRHLQKLQQDLSRILERPLPQEAADLLQEIANNKGDRMIAGEDEEAAANDDSFCWTGMRRMPFSALGPDDEPQLDGLWRLADGTPVELPETVAVSAGSSPTGECLARSRTQWRALPCDFPLSCALCERPMLTIADSYDWTEFIIPLFERRILAAGSDEGYEILQALRQAVGRNSALAAIGQLLHFAGWQRVNAAAAPGGEVLLPKIRRRLLMMQPTAMDAHIAAAQRALSWPQFLMMRVANAADLVLSETADFSEVELESAADLVRRLRTVTNLIPESTLVTAILIDDYWNRRQERRVPLAPPERKYTEQSEESQILQLHLEQQQQGRKLLETDQSEKALERVFQTLSHSTDDDEAAAAARIDSPEVHKVMDLMSRRRRIFRVWTPPLRRPALLGYILARARRNTTEFADLPFVERVFEGDNFCLWTTPSQRQYYSCGGSAGDAAVAPLVEPSRLWASATSDAERWAMLLLGAARFQKGVDAAALDRQFHEANRFAMEFARQKRWREDARSTEELAYPRLRGSESWEQLAGVLLGTGAGLAACGLVVIFLRLPKLPPPAEALKLLLCRISLHRQLRRESSAAVTTATSDVLQLPVGAVEIRRTLEKHEQQQQQVTI